MNRIQEIRLTICESALDDLSKDYLLSLTESASDVGNALATASVLGSGAAIATQGVVSIHQKRFNTLQDRLAKKCDRLKYERRPEKQAKLKEEIEHIQADIIRVQDAIDKTKQFRNGAIATAGVTGVASVGANTIAAKNKVKRALHRK